MSGNHDELEALFEAEAAQYTKNTSDPAVATAAADTVVAAPIVAAAPVAAPAGANALTLDDYFEVVNGLYQRDPKAALPPEEQVAEANPMYERLGTIVRTLHDSLRELGYDKSLSDASSQIGEAKDRLEYIATLTEQAAVKVLNTLDEGLPAQETLIKRGKEIEERWNQLYAGKIDIEEFKKLAAESREFAATVAAEGEKEKSRLLEIMMAQDFQDLTGQIIKKIVSVTKNVEQDLAHLLLENAPVSVREKHNELMSGPSLPDSALAQDDVDDMLADLGF